MRARKPNTVFANPSCSTANSYYFDRNGDTPFRHSTSLEARWSSAHFPITDYKFERTLRPATDVSTGRSD